MILLSFFDACDEPEFHDDAPTLHHFGSSNLKNEEQYLMGCWQECLQKEIIIPTHIIRHEDEDGKVERIYTLFDWSIVC